MSVERSAAARCDGPWPFITRRTHQGADGVLQVWHSRAWRKARSALALNRPIGVLFSIGSLLFAAGSVFSLWSNLAHALSLDRVGVNAIYFAGSIPFTLATFNALHAPSQWLAQDIAGLGSRLVGVDVVPCVGLPGLCRNRPRTRRLATA